MLLALLRRNEGKNLLGRTLFSDDATKTDNKGQATSATTNTFSTHVISVDVPENFAVAVLFCPGTLS